MVVNEKNIIGVINRPISNIFKLQTQLLELTKIDSENIKPVINTRNSPYTNVFVLQSYTVDNNVMGINNVSYGQ